MRTGKRIWTLGQLRPWVLGPVLLARIVAVRSVATITVLPRRLTPRALEMATATTHVVVDTPHSAALDLRQNTDSLQTLTERALPLGDVIGNEPVAAAIAYRAHVPSNLLQVTPPLTPTQSPRLQGLRTTQIDLVTAKKIAGGAGRSTMALIAFVAFGVWCVHVAVLAFRHSHHGPRRLLGRAHGLGPHTQLK